MLLSDIFVYIDNQHSTHYYTGQFVLFLTFVETFFAVNNGDSLMGQTRGSVQLTVVLVEFPIRSTYWFVVRLAAIQTLALSLTAHMVNHTVLPQTTVLMLTGIFKAVRTIQACRERKKKDYYVRKFCC